ncbi:MAG: hypothetical protein JNM95_14210 [Chitinophagaceae bacterium]|nr:hypothetical protein [Chitinophagaceae bacterium]
MKKSIEYYFLPLILIVLLFSAVGCKKKETASSSFTVICVPEEEYRSTKVILRTPYDSLKQLKIQAQVGLNNHFLKSYYNGTFNAEPYDWDISLYLGANFKDSSRFINATPYFIVYKFLPSTNPKEVVLQVEIHEGNPYNKNSFAKHTFIATGEIGQADPDTGDIAGSHYSAAIIAGKKASDLIQGSGFLK